MSEKRVKIPSTVSRPFVRPGRGRGSDKNSMSRRWIDYAQECLDVEFQRCDVAYVYDLARTY